MKKFIYFFFLSSILLLNNCTPSIPNEKPKTISEELPYNQQVFYQIFPDIFDSLRVVSYGITIPPPPPPTMEYSKDSTEYNNTIHEYKEILKQIEADTAIPIIALKDTARYNIDEAKYYSLTKLDSSQKSFKIDMEKLLVQADTFQLVYLSEVTKDNSFKLKNKFRKRVKVRFFLSNVYFDSTKTYGFLDWSIVCGPLCGEGGRIFIQNINGKWVIVRITYEWVS